MHQLTLTPRNNAPALFLPSEGFSDLSAACRYLRRAYGVSHFNSIRRPNHIFMEFTLNNGRKYMGKLHVAG